MNFFSCTATHSESDLTDSQDIPVVITTATYGQRTSSSLRASMHSTYLPLNHTMDTVTENVNTVRENAIIG